MKVHGDKIEGGLPHGLSAREIRMILANVPPEWSKGIVDVRLANGSAPKAYLFRSEGRLTIYSRKGTREQILREILHVIAAESIHILHCVARQPSKPELHRLDRYIQPVMAALLQMLSQRQDHRRLQEDTSSA